MDYESRLMLHHSTPYATKFMMLKNVRVLTELLRYSLVGVVSNVAGYVLYLLVTAYWLEPREAVSLLYFAGMLISFIGNRSFTFAYKGSTVRSGIRFIALYIMGYFMNLALLFVMVDRLGYAHELVQAVAIVVVAAFLFLGQKLLVFKAGQ